MRLSSLARHLILPEGIQTTGWPSVCATCSELGITFDEWQDGLGKVTLAKKADGLYAADIAAISISRQGGKALDLDTPLLTTAGWKTMGTVEVGDEVYHPNGYPVEVTAAHATMYDHDCYLVTTTDGRSVVADADHLWTVIDKRRASKRRAVIGERTLTTAQMVEEGLSRYLSGGHSSVTDGKRYRTNEYRFQLPVQAPLRSPDRDLPLDPYWFGAWLGDGTGVAARLHCSAEDLPHWISATSEAGFTPTHRWGTSAWEVGVARGSDCLSTLRRMGVLGDKHVPDDYLLAGSKQREALLQGLLDTDGYIDSDKGSIEFCSTSPRLADAVLFLARSLGWRAVLAEGRATLNGRDCGPKYRVTFTPKTTDEFVPFRLPRKADRVGTIDGNKGRNTVSIKSIESVPSRPVRCIKVASGDGLFLAGRDLIATHNTFWAGATIFAICIQTPTLALWTAHRTRTAAETFRSMQQFAALPKVAPHIANIRHGSGQEAVEFVNGSRILFGARERGFGRGFAGVGILFFDEGQILSEGAMDDMVPSTNTHPNPLIIMAGTPPKPTDDGEVFTVLRQEAIDGESTDVLFVEISADADADPLDRSQWVKMNPSFPARTTERAILRMHKVLSEESFRREAMGIWDPFSRHLPVIKMSDWTPLEGIAINGVRPDALGVDMNHSREISIAACWIDDDTAHAEEVWAGPSAIDAVGWLSRRASRRMPIVIDRASPAMSLISELEAARLRVIQTSTGDYVRACGLVVDRVDAKTFTHGGQQSVDDALAGARKRPIRDAGGWGWDRRDEQVNLAPLVALTLALFGASTAHRGARTRSEGRREAVVV